MSLLSSGMLAVQCRRVVLPSAGTLTRQYRWRQSTFYDILRVHPEATQAEIKESYLKLSKEYHPDMNQSVTKHDKELIHTQYVKINEAYSVLSKETERSHYDAQIFVRLDPEQFKQENNKKKPRSEAMTFEERARAYGFKPQDPKFYEKHGNYHKKIVLACVVWIVFGSFISSGFIFSIYRKHSADLEVANLRNSEVLMTSRNNARFYGTVDAQKLALSRRIEDEHNKFDSSE